MKTIKTYEEFWPHYLREHSKPVTRAWHYIGTGVGVAIFIFVLLTQRWALIPLMFLSGYFFAWASHAVVEKNRPATFTYPLWSLISDFKMLICFLTGQMGNELAQAGVSSEALGADRTSSD